MSSRLIYEFRSPSVTMWEQMEMAAGKGFSWSVPNILNLTN